MQVNLYLPELRPQQDWLTARNAAFVLVAFVLVMVAVQIVMNVRADNLEADVAKQQAALDAMQARIQDLRGSPAASASKSLDDQIAQLKLAITNREKVGRIISGQNVGNASGFRASMQALARESRDDFVLEQFTLARGGTHVQMRGEARTAQAIPLYLQRLKSDPAFADARFGLLSLSSESSRAGIQQFSLGYTNLFEQQSAGVKQQ